MEKVSMHESIGSLHEKVKKDGMSTVAERFDAQEKTRCSYCTKGISCQLCSHGPCRITKFAVGDDPVKIADGIEAHIVKKRTALGI